MDYFTNYYLLWTSLPPFYYLDIGSFGLILYLIFLFIPFSNLLDFLLNFLRVFLDGLLQLNSLAFQCCVYVFNSQELLLSLFSEYSLLKHTSILFYDCKLFSHFSEGNIDNFVAFSPVCTTAVSFFLMLWVLFVCLFDSFVCLSLHFITVVFL